MRSARALLFDYALVAGLIVLVFAATTGFIRSRHAAETKSGRWILIAAVGGLVVMLAVFGSDAVDTVTGQNRDTYPDQSPALILLGFLASSLLTIAVYDSVSTRATQLVRRGLNGEWMTTATLPVLILIGVAGIIGVLSQLEPNQGEGTSNPDPADTATSTTTAVPTRPPTITLVPIRVGDGEDLETVPNLVLRAITSPGDLQFSTFLASPPGDDRLFILERFGRVRVIDDTGLRPEPLIDITDSVGPGTDGGLIGLAFHPGFSDNGRLFLHYTDLDDDNRIVEYRVDPATAVLLDEPPLDILHVEKPAEGFHAGGMLQFGPDGYLYIAIGDPNPSAAQNPASLRGILRIDVDAASPYAIPPENAFGDGAPNETFAYGLRNPYRFWIDPATNHMFIGDPGEETWEEIDVVDLKTAGVNFGWNITEGMGCFFEGTEFVASCDRAGLEEPILVYRNLRANPPGASGGGCAVILGAMYRGADMPDLDGTVFYADYCTNWIGSFRYDDGRVTDSSLWHPTEALTLGTVISFGVDAEGELYLLTSADGMIYKFATG